MIHAQTMKGSMLFLADMTSAETATAALDTLGAHYATIAINAKLDGTATTLSGITLALTESDDATTYATFDSDNAISGWNPGTAGKVHVYHVNLQKRKRYLKVSLTTGAGGTTNDNAVVSAVGFLSRNESNPASTTGLGDVVVIS